jgi:hypothetical protein
MMFTLPQVAAWTTSDLTAHAAHWRDLAAKRRDVSGAVKNDADGLPWTGGGDTHMRTAVGAHHTTATGQAELLEKAAQDASDAASVGQGQQKAIMNMVEQAKGQGFGITPTWEAIDTQYAPGTIEWASRQPAAVSYSTMLSAAAAQFTEHDTTTGMKMASYAVTLGGNDVTGHVTMAGHGFKTDGGEGSQAPWNPAYGPPNPPPVVPRPDGSLPMPALEHPSTVINNHGGQTPVPVNPRDHEGTLREIVDGVGKVVIGGGTEVGGALMAPPTGGASLIGSIPAGAWPIFDGLEDLSHMTNLGRLPDAPPIIGQDGPG